MEFVDRMDHKTLLIGECKWTSGENGRLLTRRLQRIADALPFAQEKDIRIVLFSKAPEDNLGIALLSKYPASKNQIANIPHRPLYSTFGYFTHLSQQVPSK